MTGWTTTGSGAPVQVSPSQSGQAVTWNLGNIAPSSQDRTITIQFTATLTTAITGSSVRNSVQLGWNRVDNDSSTRVTKTSTADETILNPVLGIAKTVDNQPSIVANPGQSFTYRVTVTNTGNTPAFNVDVRDAVPSGVVVDASTISNGGTITGQDATTGGGGTITWHLAPRHR